MPSPPSAVATTTGLRVIASVDRMATCGWLMIGMVNTLPAEPLLEMVNVPPLISSGPSLRLRRAARQIVDLAGDGPQPLALGATYHRDEQALVVEIDGDADVDEVVHDEILFRHAGVEVRELVDCLDDGSGDERQVREPEALGCLPLRLHRVAGEVDVGEVDLDDAEGVRTDTLAHHHVAAGELADLRQTHRRVAFAGRERRRGVVAGAGWRRRGAGAAAGAVSGRPRLRVPVRLRAGGACARRCSACLRGTAVDEVEHVVARDPPAGTRAGDLIDIDVVFGHQAAHHG